MHRYQVQAVAMLFILLLGGNALFAQAPCPNDNSFNGFPNPFNVTGIGAPGAVTSTNSWGGDYLNTDVVSGAEYTWTACGNTQFNGEFTLREDGTGNLLAFSSDFCGTQPEITWTATLTGRVRLLIDQNPCTHNSTHFPVTLTQNTPGGGLPIEILYFTGNYEQGSVNLSWQFSESAAYQSLFVERSDDGAEFTSFLSLPSATEIGKSYQVSDPHPFPKRTYYRLKSVDGDGLEDYSKTLEVITPVLQKMSVYPNPSEGIFYLFFATDAEQVPAELLNHLGKKVWTGTLLPNSAGYIEQKLAFSHLNKGVYFLRLREGNGHHTQRILIH